MPWHPAPARSGTPARKASSHTGPLIVGYVPPAVLRLSITLLLVPAVLWIASGGLLRPCGCAPLGLGAPVEEVSRGWIDCSCCGVDDEAEIPEPSAPERGHGPRICSQGPAPATAPGKAVELPDRTHAAPALGILDSASRPQRTRTPDVGDVDTTGAPPWLRSPAGLARFVI
jgi:hypothetical protein